MDIIIYPPTIDWTFMKQRPQHLMKQFADKGYVVFYCNKTVNEKDMKELSPNLYLVHQHEKWLKEIYPAIRKQNQSRVGVWCSLPKLAGMLDRYEADWIIYDCVDEFPEWLKYEKEMVSVSNAVVCTAEKIHSRLTKEYPEKKIELIRNGYDKNMRLHLPSKNNKQPSKKQIGYIGAWAPWIDEGLISKIAATLKEIELIVIGIEFGRKFTLHHLPNIKYLGHLPHDQLTNYLHRFSVCIIPFKITPVTLATNPVKMYEYLAAGKPVISTNLPECAIHPTYVDIANTHAEFIQRIKARLEDPGKSGERINFALKHTWEHRIDQAISIIHEIAK